MIGNDSSIEEISQLTYIMKEDVEFTLK